MNYELTIPLRLRLLTICVIIETLSFTYFRDIFSLDINTFLFIVSGLGVSFIALLPNKPSLKNNHVLPVITKKIFLLLSAFGICTLIIYRSINTIQSVPFGAWADMMPFIKVQCSRFLHGEAVYTPIKELWGQMPSYLPMYWLPYVPFVALNIDIRYMLPIFLVLAVIYIYCILYKKPNIPVLLLVSGTTGLFLLVNYCVTRNIVFMACTEESAGIFYYVFLGWTLIIRKPWLIGVAIANCIMSRFMLIGWAPFFFYLLAFV